MLLAFPVKLPEKVPTVNVEVDGLKENAEELNFIFG
jgi:hypothetical protein